MDQLNPTQINEALKDVRNAYRLLALYQKRILDIVKYVSNKYNTGDIDNCTGFQGGYSKFSKQAPHGNRVSIDDKWSWDWLSMYLYEFNLGSKTIEANDYHFKIVHQADTGFYDASIDKNISKLSSDQFGDVDGSKTRLFFVLSKNDNGCPMQHVLNGNLTTHDNQQILNGNWLAVPFDLQRFASQETTDGVLQEFNAICLGVFGIELINMKTEIDISEM